MKIALIQFQAGTRKEDNLFNASKLIEQAARRKARLVLLPELFIARTHSRDISGNSECLDGPSVKFLKEAARQNEIFLLAGSVYEKIAGSKKVYNTSLAIDPQGRTVASYRKINLFKAVLGKKKIDETKHFRSGKRLSAFSCGLFKVGLAICYDLRFPSLFNCLAQKGVNVFAIPSNFTQQTGRAHWEILCRARAIENASYVLALNQVGKNEKGVVSYGCSLVVDPWGAVIAKGSATRQEIIYARLKMSAIKKAKNILPGRKRKRGLHAG